MEAGRSCVPEVTAPHPRSCALCPPARLLPGPDPGWVLRNPAPLCPRQASVTLTLQPPRPESHLTSLGCLGRGPVTRPYTHMCRGGQTGSAWWEKMGWLAGAQRRQPTEAGGGGLKSGAVLAVFN